MSEEITVQYNAPYFELIKNLTAISPGIIFSRDSASKQIVVNRTNKGRSIFFKVTAPEEYFQFSSSVDKVAFYNFAEFYNLMNAIGCSKLIHKDNKIIIESAIGKVNYVLSAPETLAKSPTKINVSDPDMSFNLSSETLIELKKINSMMNAKYAKISNQEKSITIKLFNSAHENSFDKIFVPETVSEDIEDFDFPIYSDVFSKIPTSMNYKVSLFKRGYMFFTFENAGIEFIAVTSRVKKIGEESTTDESGEDATEKLE